MELLPYANSQPNVKLRENKQSYLIHRMPPLADANGINKEFQKFYDDIVDAFTTDFDKLYEISDKVLDKENFHKIMVDIFISALDEISTISNNNDNAYNFDIELDMNEFQNNFRNIIGSFNIMYYVVDPKVNDFTNELSTTVTKYITKIYFTYKNNEFKIISYFKPFTFETIGE